MEIFGVGASELIFILLIAIIVLGPKDMQKAGRTIGRWLNQLVRSDSWRIFQRTSSELRNLPRNLMREANMELQEVDQELRRSIDPRQSPSSVPGNPSANPGTDLPRTNEMEIPPQSPSEASSTQNNPKSAPNEND